ncbi:MAG: phytanoyl-CoA dioxygenase family protein [Alphaproteobacteria bacterium]|jgi:ectoine hydroxylase-related dioxygenase (phytanoyl-CoA dioxygenase family)|nr:phytanoyl-CoA dioxygenase family protein [Alphaproteobacteria bacterium]|tara:strand:- start:1229 stop:2083 length:855 start_codon:yes stop_codon:yes gene_type:complete
MTKLDQLNEQYSENGWMTLDLTQPEIVFEARDAMVAFLRESFFSTLERLEDLHEHISDNESYIKVHLALNSFFREQQFAKRIISSELDAFQKLISPDLCIQTNPYLRVARPGVAGDNIGLHRDTFYGASPYELSVVVAYTDLDEGGALRVVSGSQGTPENEIRFHEVNVDGVERGSPRHLAGIPYIARVVAPEIASKAVPVPLTVGQVLIFGLATVHGQKINQGAGTRVTTDIRVVNGLAPFVVKRAGPDAYYTLLSQSPVSEQADLYLQANPDRQTDKGGGGY